MQRLGKGAQGSVFLVEDKNTGQKLVLKKVALLKYAQYFNVLLVLHDLWDPRTHPRTQLQKIAIF